MTYTPGPWTEERHPNKPESIVNIHGGNLMEGSICTMWKVLKSQDTFEANISLVKAAPDLLAALKSITLSMSAHPDCTEGSEFADMVVMATKAINLVKD